MSSPIWRYAEPAKHVDDWFDYLGSVRGNCTCQHVPEACFCLQGHYPAQPLKAKQWQFEDHPHQYESLYYDATTGVSSLG